MPPSHPLPEIALLLGLLLPLGPVLPVGAGSCVISRKTVGAETQHFTTRPVIDSAELGSAKTPD